MSELSRCESVYYTPCWRIRPTVIEAASKHLTTTFLIGTSITPNTISLYAIASRRFYALHLILLVDL
ncbi:hypothetical protein HBI56_148470 [Parastagonospora nodorum]|uniref:Uncharacterized protein n=1 Tax=Phaeosphaeria nodorum (strain SN15 / ATCC MYA-4574 / FGSC 10173) TaxID=321614 RepID=A0A7U2IBZ2_PHANO|nr:hypothetical protein HBH56_076390 [Parastagonospora nodorum]QRD06875.1 hypothetical protein JI435_423800 [Parastagonospora nodorum SN15]KAH3927317.1 hypothetical protein HBH54_156630 [Parastagonospora nodorum]KAH3952047.1 hypothetical protein HBH53_051760 [Parastagonospora nodorum]KAH3981763.1 hypothetical protein HBH51_043340 [Parastagonospora nodorum]